MENKFNDYHQIWGKFQFSEYAKITLGIILLLVKKGNDPPRDASHIHYCLFEIHEL